jgi:hypothetical protein
MDKFGRLPSFEAKVQNLVNRILVSNDETYTVILAILNNIINFFDNEKVRKLSLVNKKIQQYLISVPEAIELLVLFKFVKTESHLELKRNAVTLKDVITFRTALEKAEVRVPNLTIEKPTHYNRNDTCYFGDAKSLSGAKYRRYSVASSENKKFWLGRSHLSTKREIVIQE